MIYTYRLAILYLMLMSSMAYAQGIVPSPPNIEARSVGILFEDQLKFKDLNKNNQLDVYEDWRQPVSKRIEDLVDQMTLDEKVGMLLINTLNAGKMAG